MNTIPDRSAVRPTRVTDSAVAATARTCVRCGGPVVGNAIRHDGCAPKVVAR